MTVLLEYLDLAFATCSFAYRENLSLQSIPTSPDSSPPQTMVNTQQTSTTVASASVGMVLYAHVEDSQELFL